MEHPKQTKDNDGANVGQATVGAMPIDTAPRSGELWGAWKEDK